MELKIDIPDRLYNDVKEMCEYNKYELTDFIVQCVSDTFYIMKYGDLNEKIKNKETEKVKQDNKKETKEIEKIDKEKKKRGRPKKVENKTEETLITPISDEVIAKTKEQPIVKKEEVSTVVDNGLQTKINRTRRILKTK